MAMLRGGRLGVWRSDVSWVVWDETSRAPRGSEHPDADSTRSVATTPLALEIPKHRLIAVIMIVQSRGDGAASHLLSPVPGRVVEATWRARSVHPLFNGKPVVIESR